MEKKKVVSLALVSMISMGMLAGCGSTEMIEEQTGAIKSDSPVVEESYEISDFEKQYFEQYVEIPEAKTFAPGEHVFFIRYSYTASSENFTSGRVEVPEGYEILEIENYNEYVGYGSQTSGVDIWYINNESVVVEPVYKNEIRNDRSRMGYYDYANFGTVIELEQESNKSLTK